MNINVTRIEVILANKGLTRAALGKMAGISRQSISTILARGSCSTINAGKIARALGVDAEELVVEVKKHESR